LSPTAASTFVIVIVLSLEPKTTTAPRTQNKRSADRSADHVGVRALWRWREEQKKRFLAHALPFTIDVDFDGQFSTKLEGFELALL
jgi:hypothetical protein